MRKLLVLLLLATAVRADSVLTLTGPPAARPGTTIPVILTLSGTSVPVGLQWVVGYPAGYTATVSASIPNKQLSCTSDKSFCILVAQNVLPIANGVVATYLLSIPAAASGNVAVPPLNTILAVDAVGINIPITSGPIYSFTISSRQDINVDGVVNSLDYIALHDMIIAARTNPAACTADQDGDNDCDLTDLLIVVRKILNP